MTTSALVQGPAASSRAVGGTRVLPRPSAATVAALRERGEDATVEVVELREHARDLADH